MSHPAEVYARVIKSQIQDLQAFVSKNDPTQETLNFYGIQVNLEWLAGQKREYKEVPEEERKTLQAHYGYVRNTESEDGEELDVYVSSETREKTVFMLVQVSEVGAYDEIKFMLGFPSMEAAQLAFTGSMPANMFGAIFPCTWEKFEDLALGFYKS